MKLNLLLCLILLFSFGQLYPQQFYLKALGGYGLGVAQDELTSLDYLVTQNESKVIQNSEEYSFGKGVNASVAAGYNFNSFISAEVEFGYHKSGKINYTDVRNYQDTYEDGTYELSATSFYINPTIVLRTEISSFEPYLKIGPAIAFSGVDMIADYITKEQGVTYNYHLNYEYRGGVAFGINSAIGIAYNLNSTVSILFEINNKSMSYSPEEGELTEATANGITILDRYSAKSKKFNFADKVTSINSQSNGDHLKIEYPFSSLSFLLGVSVEL